MKVGYQGSYQRSLQGRVANQTQLQYRFNNGVPNAFRYYISPRWEQNDRTGSASLFIQDQWTKDRLTLQGAVRFDHAWSFPPRNTLDDADLTLHAAPISFPKTITCRLQASRLGCAPTVSATARPRSRYLGKYLRAHQRQIWAPTRRTHRHQRRRACVRCNRNYVSIAIFPPSAQTTWPPRDTAVAGEMTNFLAPTPTRRSQPRYPVGVGHPFRRAFVVSFLRSCAVRCAERRLQPAPRSRLLRHRQYPHDRGGLHQWNVVPQNPLLPSPEHGPTTTHSGSVAAAHRIFQTFETDYVTFTDDLCIAATPLNALCAGSTSRRVTTAGGA